MVVVDQYKISRTNDEAKLFRLLIQNSYVFADFFYCFRLLNIFIISLSQVTCVQCSIHVNSSDIKYFRSPHRVKLAVGISISYIKAITVFLFDPVL